MAEPSSAARRLAVLGALLVLAHAAHGSRALPLERVRGAALLLSSAPAPSGQPGIPVTAAAWLGVSVASGSQALLAFAALPTALPARTRRAIAAAATLAVLIAFDALLAALGRRAAARAELSPRRAGARESLADAAQSLAMVAAGWASASAASMARVDASQSHLERVALCGAAACACAMRSIRPPTALHTLLPFAALLAHSYVDILRRMRGVWSCERSVSYVSVCAFASGVAAVACLAALAAERRCLRRAARDGTPRSTHSAQLVGLEPVAVLAVVAQLAWTATCLGTWALARAPAFGFALVASSVSATEVGVHALRRADGGDDRPHSAADADVRAVWPVVAAMLRACTRVLLALAAWRALWFAGTPAAPGARSPASRLQRHFLSLVLTFGASFASGAARADAWQAVGSVSMAVLVIARTIADSLFNESPLVLAGGVGLLLGGALVGALVAFGT
ncbi:hypothetical protein KFE25_011635 [Diacronema lutheri]|uniref:Dolichol kinase n=1 Tax=Diacronema lutheri TaxID=2081491 RepID=A0A8J6CA24_DIALT|nr:hypothetical protein KFE25_011635 [Diacronema lutheri]